MFSYSGNINFIKASKTRSRAQKKERSFLSIFTGSLKNARLFGKPASELHSLTNWERHWTWPLKQRCEPALAKCWSTVPWQHYISIIAQNVNMTVVVKSFPFSRRPRVTLQVYWHPLARHGPDYLLFTRCLKFNCEVRCLTKACPRCRRGGRVVLGLEVTDNVGEGIWTWTWERWVWQFLTQISI